MPSIIPIPAFRDNYIWVLRSGDHAAVVDPGDAAPVLAWLDANRVELTAILATHHHADHVGGVPALRERFDVPVFGPAHENIPQRTHALGEGDRIVVPGLELMLSVFDIPAHTAGHIAYYTMPPEPMLFCGDTMFAAGCGRLFEGTAEQMWTSLSKLVALDQNTLVYCGHEYTLANLRFAQAVEPGNHDIEARVVNERGKRERDMPTLPSTVGAERATNPFVRANLPHVMASASAHAKRTVDDPVDSLAVLREWKDHFA